MRPRIEVHKLSIGTGAREKVLSSQLQRLDAVTRRTLVGPSLKLPFSFETIEVTIFANRGANVRATRNGVTQMLQQRGEEYGFLFTLRYDNEAHVINVTVDGLFVSSISILFNHHYAIRKENCVSFLTPKWTIGEWGIEFQRCRDLFDWRQPTGTAIDAIPRHVERKVPKDQQEWASRLHSVILEFCRFLFTANSSELRTDFGIEEPNRLNLQAVLNATKANPRLLEEHPQGPFAIGGARYTTQAVRWKYESSDLLDMSPVINVVGTLMHLLKRQNCPMVTLDLLMRVMHYCRGVSHVPERTQSSLEVLYFLRKRMRTSAGRQVLYYLWTIRKLIDWPRHHGSPAVKAEEGLLSGVRDFDVFEWSTFWNIASALGYSNEQIQTGRPLLNTGEHHLLNCNIEGAALIRRQILPGWRDESVQPSHYQPDLLVMFNGTIPVLVDAKFRMSLSIEHSAPADAIKEMQAYLDEFDQRYAIVVVPSIPFRSVDPGGILHAITGELGGRTRSIFVLPLNPLATDRFRNEFLDSLQKCVALHG